MPVEKFKSTNRIVFNGQYDYRAIVLYKIPLRRLKPHVPNFFEIPAFTSNHKEYAYVGIEFIVNNTIWYKHMPYSKFNAHITNYFALVLEKQSGSYGIFYWGGVLSTYLRFWKAAVWNSPWYSALIQIKSLPQDAAQDKLLITNSASQLSLSLEARTDKTIEVDDAILLDDLNVIQNPSFYSFESTSRGRQLHFYKLQRNGDSRNYLRVNDIHAEVMQNLCLIKPDEMKIPYVSFSEGKQQYDIKFLKYHE